MEQGPVLAQFLADTDFDALPQAALQAGNAEYWIVWEPPSAAPVVTPRTSPWS